MDAVQWALAWSAILVIISALPSVVVAILLMLAMGVLASIGAGLTTIIILLGVLRIYELYLLRRSLMT